jgi:hypothetical protein
MPETDALALSEKHHVFVWLLHTKGFKKERMTHVRLYAIGPSTPLASSATFARLFRLSAWGVSHDAPLRCRRLFLTAATCGTTARASETNVRL